MRTLIAAVLGCSVIFSSTVLADNQNPSVVQGVNAVSESASSIKVTWNRASDNVGIDGYNVYRNNIWYATVANTNQFIDTQIIGGVVYRYAVTAFDRARNYSRMSQVVSASSNDAASDNLPTNNPAASQPGVKPATPQNLRALAQSQSSIRLVWNTPRGGAEGYNIYIDGRYNTTVRGTNQYIANALIANRSYDFQIAAFRGNEFSVTSPKVSATTASNGNGSPQPTPSLPSPPPPQASGKPSAPTGVQATFIDNASVQLSWNTPEGGAEGYNVYINGSYDTSIRGRNNALVSGLDGGRNHNFYVVAFRNGLFSVNSASVSVNTAPNGPAAPPPANSGNSAVPNGYSLVFSEDFNGWNIDSTKWNTQYRWGANYIINREEQYYVDTLNNPDFGASPFSFSGDKLSIQATRTPDWLSGKAAGQKYLSGAMTTFQKFTLRYGYVEMRAKMPAGKGLWPAFWLLHEADDKRRPEIDVMEMLGGNPRLVYQTYHYYDNNNLQSTPSFRAPGPDYSSDFHTFGMLWEPNRIVWYVDGQETNRFESDTVSDENMYLLLNLALGGSWADSPDGSTPFPARYEIDYVRAYKR